MVSAPVQADRTGDRGRAQRPDAGFLTNKGVTTGRTRPGGDQEHQPAAGQFETSGAVLGAMMDIDMLGKPDNSYETLAPEYRTLTAATLDKAARSAMNPKGFTWIVVGDAAKVRPQLEKLGIPIEVVEAP